MIVSNLPVQVTDTLVEISDTLVVTDTLVKIGDVLLKGTNSGYVRDQRNLIGESTEAVCNLLEIWLCHFQIKFCWMYELLSLKIVRAAECKDCSSFCCV